MDVNNGELTTSAIYGGLVDMGTWTAAGNPYVVTGDYIKLNLR